VGKLHYKHANNSGDYPRDENFDILETPPFTTAGLLEGDTDSPLLLKVGCIKNIVEAMLSEVWKCIARHFPI
jgi:hypothetical protein